MAKEVVDQPQLSGKPAELPVPPVDPTELKVRDDSTENTDTSVGRVVTREEGRVRRGRTELPMPVHEPGPIQEPASADIEQALRERGTPSNTPLQARRNLEPEEIRAGHGQFVDGVRYIVVVRRFPNEPPRPVYVTDAFTGERLPTTCTALIQEGDRWFAQLSSRVSGSYHLHEGLDPVTLLDIGS